MGFLKGLGARGSPLAYLKNTSSEKTISNKQEAVSNKQEAVNNKR
jgi:hypothetical protein